MSNKSALICPHCHGEVPYGARVCRGYQAEVEYGIPLEMVMLIYFIFLGLSIVLAIYFGSFLVGIVAFIAGIYFLQSPIDRKFKNRIVFKRRYKTF